MQSIYYGVRQSSESPLTVTPAEAGVHAEHAV